MLKLLRPQSYNGLLLGLFLLIVASPLVQYLERGAWLLEIALMVVLLFAIHEVTGDRHGLRVALFLGAPAVLGSLLAVAWADPPAIVVALISVFTLCFIVAVIVIVLRHIMTGDRVSGDTLRGAVCVYILLGVAWAIAYNFVHYFEPDAFSVAGHFGDQEQGFALDVYFSFVTLTTLGYGDISPISPVARTLAWLEACVGQLFVAITIARLVSLYIAGIHQPTDVDEPGASQ